LEQWLKLGINAWGTDIVDVLDSPKLRMRLIICPLWKLSAGRIFDVAVAADVLEHLPTELVDDSLAAISKSTSVLIAQNAEYDSLGWGAKLHLTIKPAEWWMERMQGIGGTVERLELISAPKAPKHLLRWEP